MAARKSAGGKGQGGRLWPAKLGMFALRVHVGVMFVMTAHWKLILPEGGIKDAIVQFAEGDYAKFIHQGIEHPPVIFGVEMTWYSSFLDAVMLGGQAPYVLGGMILFFEGVLGFCLVLGLCTRLMGLLGGLLMLAFAWAKGPYLPFYTQQMPNYLLMVVLFALALTAAGRIWGLDARLRHKLPGWIA